MMNMVVFYVLVCIFAYLIGSIPTGYIIVKLLKNEDIRETGSGSTGATNVKRVLGNKWFFTVMLLDALKGFLPVFFTVYLASQRGDEQMLAPVLAGFMVLVGHSKSIFLKFKGGKSVASGVGTLIALSPVVGLAVAAVWGIVTFFTRYVSVGSIVAIFVAPLLMLATEQPLSYVTYCGVMGILIIKLHSDNLDRLKKGEENKVR